MNKLKVVVVGTMFGNKSIHGPFDDDEHINQWVAQYVGHQPYEIVHLETHGTNQFQYPSIPTKKGKK